MNSQAFKELSFFSALGVSCLLLIGYAAGLYTNPVVNSLENQDLKRDLQHTEQQLEAEQEEVKAKRELVDEFIKNYKELSK